MIIYLNFKKRKQQYQQKWMPGKASRAPPRKSHKCVRVPSGGGEWEETWDCLKTEFLNSPSVKKTLTDTSKDPMNSGRLKPKSCGPRSPRSSLWKTNDLGNSRKNSSKLRTRDTQELLSEMKAIKSHTANATGRLVSKASAPIKEFFKVRAEWSHEIRQNRA